MEAMTFDSAEEAFDYMQRQEQEAMARLYPRQRAIDFDSYYVRDLGEFMIFGHILPKAERDQGEDPQTIQDLDSGIKRGYVYGVHYSIHCPLGEYGDVHIANIWPITKEDFKTAEGYEWDVEKWIRMDNDGVRLFAARIRHEMEGEESSG